MSSDWTCHVKKEFFNNKSPSVWIKCSLSFHSHAIRYKWIFSLLSVLFCLLFCLNAIVDVVNQSPNSTHMWMCCWLYIPSDSESLMISNWCHCHLLFHFLRAGHGWFNVGRLSIGKKKLSPIDSLWRVHGRMTRLRWSNAIQWHPTTNIMSIWNRKFNHWWSPMMIL